MNNSVHDAVTTAPSRVRPQRLLIVNADDFGASTLTNRGIIDAHERGIVTSTSLMVRGRAVTEATGFARSHPSLSFGLHVDLGEWAYQDGQWVTVYEVVCLANCPAIDTEVRRQLDIFRRYMGCDPTHLDSHQHVHRDDPARSVLVNLGQELDIPVRHCTPKIQYCGRFYGQSGKGYPYPEGITVASLSEALRALPVGISEIGCHPGWDGSLASAYRLERCSEVTSLCDPLIRSVLAEEEIALHSFEDFVKSIAVYM